ncbi:hypothetical protein TUM17561_29840 [Enterobacter cloacae]|nr:hypothetical protein NMCA_31510 [Enterobacter ludwigii]GJK55566.1 hypothetical protein TUM17561_29840 [Enterobacter cloacae]GLH24529.1 hypothetical protein ENT52713_19250 [Enterobacter sp. 200527-13]
MSVTPSAIAEAMKPSGLSEATTAALTSCAVEPQRAADNAAKRSVFLCNIMRLIIVMNAWDVIL